MTFSPRALEQGSEPHFPTRRRTPMMRRYDVQALDVNGAERFTQHIAPATPEFENAFNAFARGVAIMTDQGPRPVEDLRPGMMIETLEQGRQPLRWIGSMTMVPNAPCDDPAQVRLIRVTNERFGPAKPGIDLMVGPGARLLHSPDGLRNPDGRRAAYTDFAQFVDGDSVFEITPPAPIETFHIALERHATVLAEGLPVEAYHPGYHMEEQMGPNKLSLFLSLFPHVTELEDFGLLANPRMTLRALHDLDAA